ncbi:M3 family oligoendopeptidase [Liberibacter crescens]|nr:M3 family oligoendopeptidase [Liberibacter crescens]
MSRTLYKKNHFLQILFQRNLADSEHRKFSCSEKDLGILPQWKLEDLYPSPDSKEFTNDLDYFNNETVSFEKRWKGHLENAANSSGQESLGTAISEYEKLSELGIKISSYAQLNHYSNLSDPVLGKFYADTMAQLTNISSRLIFFDLEINKLDDVLLEKICGIDPLVAHYFPWIKNIRRYKPHLLDGTLEHLFMETSQTGNEAFVRLYDETSASLRFEVDNVALTLGEVSHRLQESDEQVRKTAAMSMVKTFKENARLFSFITNTLAKDKEISDRWRKYQDPADSRHLSNDVEREVVESLVAAVKSSYSNLAHRYYKLKSQWLGMQQMNFWDRLAPLPDTPQSIIPFTKAKDIVLSAYDDFSPKMSKIAEMFFTNNWIDTPQRPGKASGAFAHPTVPSVHPYILINYLGTPLDVMTLAHEIGHGIHQVLAADQGILMSGTPLTMAETASIFGETLTFQALYKQISNSQERKGLLARKIEDMLATVVRQIAFYDFEYQIHTERRKGELPIERISEIWKSTQTQSLGPSVNLDHGYETLWMMIPHFIHSPFYVYAYAFGNCLVNSLYAIYESGQLKDFQEKYLTLLRAGGSQNYSKMLKPFGINATDPSFWTQGLKIIENLIDDLATMDNNNPIL